MKRRPEPPIEVYFAILMTGLGAAFFFALQLWPPQ